MTATARGSITCRFCGRTTSNISAAGAVCIAAECQKYAASACRRVLPCSHLCGGILGETDCPPCLYGCSKTVNYTTVYKTGEVARKADDICSICHLDRLSAAPVIRLDCTHIFHYHCCKLVLMKRWSGPRISFRFLMCPLCQTKQIKHKHLSELLTPLEQLYDDVRQKAATRLQYENMQKCKAITNPGSLFYQKPTDFALQRYAYYICFKCSKPYYGGQAQCSEQVVLSDDYNPAELVCGGCSDVVNAQVCSKHGTEYIGYKCRYCCSMAVFFCFGTTHFCPVCHNDHVRVTHMEKSKMPQCPVGPGSKQLSGTSCPLQMKHPPTGEEFALGCGLCKNEQTF